MQRIGFFVGIQLIYFSHKLPLIQYKQLLTPNTLQTHHLSAVTVVFLWRIYEKTKTLEVPGTFLPQLQRHRLFANYCVDMCLFYQSTCQHLWWLWTRTRRRPWSFCSLGNLAGLWCCSDKTMRNPFAISEGTWYCIAMSYNTSIPSHHFGSVFGLDRYCQGAFCCFKQHFGCCFFIVVGNFWWNSVWVEIYI